jgi:hypothetical protein
VKTPFIRATWLLVVVLCLSVAATALARPKKKRGRAKEPVIEAPVEPEPEPEPEPIPEEPPPDERWTDAPESEPTEGEGAQDAGPADDEAAPTGKPSWWVGAYLDGVWVPGFMLGLFLDGPPTVGNAAFGAQVTHRNEDGFSWVLGLGYAGYGFEGPFQKTGDPDEDTELFSFEYGIGLDLGIVTGELERTEAYRTPSGQYAACLGPGIPLAIAASGVPYCEQPTRNGVPIAGTNTYDEFGAHYGVIEERVPPVAILPALPQIALRFTPIRNVAVKLEASYGIFQFRFGLSAAYGLDL